MSITTTERDQMRAQIEATLTDTCEIQTYTEVDAGYGNTKLTWETTATVACRVATMGQLIPRESLTEEQITTMSLWRVSLPAETAVAINQRVIGRGHTLEVIGVNSPQTNEIIRRVIAKEIS